MPFSPNTFVQPILDKVLGFSGGRFAPFQQAHLSYPPKIGH